MNARMIPVVIVGAGPTGLTAATVLGGYGVECLVLDRWESIYPQPRAVHLDDEVYRILARLGLGDAFAAISATPQTMLAVVSGFKRTVNYGIRPVGALIGGHSAPRSEYVPPSGSPASVPCSGSSSPR